MLRRAAHAAPRRPSRARARRHSCRDRSPELTPAHGEARTGRSRGEARAAAATRARIPAAGARGPAGEAEKARAPTCRRRASGDAHAIAAARLALVAEALGPQAFTPFGARRRRPCAARRAALPDRSTRAPDPPSRSARCVRLIDRRPPVARAEARTSATRSPTSRLREERIEQPPPHTAPRRAGTRRWRRAPRRPPARPTTTSARRREPEEQLDAPATVAPTPSAGDAGGRAAARAPRSRGRALRASATHLSSVLREEGVPVDMKKSAARSRRRRAAAARCPRPTCTTPARAEDRRLVVRTFCVERRRSESRPGSPRCVTRAVARARDGFSNAIIRAPGTITTEDTPTPSACVARFDVRKSRNGLVHRNGAALAVRARLDDASTRRTPSCAARAP